MKNRTVPFSLHRIPEVLSILSPEFLIEELIEIVAGKMGVKPELICSGNRQRQYSEARSVVAWLAVEEIGHPAAVVARFLGISRVAVLLSLEKAKEICRKYEFELTPSNLSGSICRKIT
jgi:chromosomal replication initiation ATPase DnaA